MRIRFSACLLNQASLLTSLYVLPLSTDQPKLEILEYRIVEEEWILLDKTNLGPPPRRVNGMDVHSFCLDSPIAEV
jgi:hypothetical protein